ncbi:hypothetical protein SpCBS45565_g05804 [Spizellomyces sp. 'palustris']|nr:hypothetical protein SpCBS45565_g05804 [Spizellomyces sp. 'palustris']
MPKPAKSLKKNVQSNQKVKGQGTPTTISTIWTPSLSLATKALCVARLLAAIYSNISDCDEVFNYWEPTHYLQYGWGMQTWEYSPKYSIRSWTYVSLHSAIGRFIETLISKEKITVFYETRGALALASALCEAQLYDAVVKYIGPRVGRYLLFILLLNTGMFISSTAYLPSTFAMYSVTLATAYSLQPPGRLRTYVVVILIGLGALVGWPFSAAIGLPFVMEEVLLSGRPLTRVRRLVEAGLLALVLILGPLIIVDYYFYNRWTIVPLNIVLYNVFGGKDRGPDIYGTEPWWFYLINGALNFNIIFPAALASLPAILLSNLLDGCKAASEGSKAKYNVWALAAKMSPMYLWLAIFTMQPHKEERFLFVVYPLICLNGALMLYFARSWLERLFTHLTAKNRAIAISSFFTRMVLIVFALMSISRSLSLYIHYHAPMNVYPHVKTLPSLPLALNVNASSGVGHIARERNLCVGKEWYRFPSHYFLPEGVRLRYLKSDFAGLLPKYFEEETTSDGNKLISILKEQGLESYIWALRHGRRLASKEVDGMNDRNQEVMDRYVRTPPLEV